MMNTETREPPLSPSFFGMRIAIFHAMALTVWRDRAAFALTFILPPIIFVIFAAVFSAAAGGDISIRIGVVSPDGDEVTASLVENLAASELINKLEKFTAIDELQEAITSGAIDSGLEIQRADETAVPNFKIYFDPVKSGAATLLEAALAAQQPVDEDFDDSDIIAPAEHISVSAMNGPVPMASYYIAGVGMLFIFLSAFQGALSVIEERDSGVMERIAAGPLGIRPMIEGKFAYLVVQGIAQFLVIILVAGLVFRVPMGLAPGFLLISIIAAAVSASGIALGVVGLCSTRSQAHAVGAVLSLIMGAIGGSMAPRFLMAPQMRSIGAFTPNAWGIDAFAMSLWRGGSPSEFAVPILLLVASGLIGLIIANRCMQRTLSHR